MKPRIISCIASLGLLALTPGIAQTLVQSGIPHLQKQGTATQMVVDGKPFLMIGGELLNSSSSSRKHMETLWPKLAAMPMNTVLTPLAWDMIEPQEGAFDFTLVDGLIEDARKNNLHLVFLWLASWKNGMSSYMPIWVKKDFQRFPRVPEKDGSSRELLTPLSDASSAADAKAFAALMRHIKQVDQQHTVLMMQVENEVGILNDSRDRSTIANKAFASAVPKELMNYLQKHKATLIPEFLKIWQAAGAKTSGTWEEVFGPGEGTDEIFMAWHYARYVERVTQAGKAEYPIPMYANCWLLQKDFPKPGSYPSGGPLPHLMDVWHAAAPSIDILAPDLYAPNFDEWCVWYTRSGNPLFIPETNSGASGASNVFFAVAQHNAMGFSPFGIDMAAMFQSGANPTAQPGQGGPRNTPDLGKSYATILQLAPIILKHQGLGQMTGFQLSKEHPSVTAKLGDYELEISLDALFGRTAESGFGMIIATGPDEFVGAGTGFMVKFKPLTPGLPQAGIASVVEGVYQDGVWVPGRHLNGDETAQGLNWRCSSFGVSIQHCSVYRFR